MACENALPRYDWAAFEKIVQNARPDGINAKGHPNRRISAFTFLRLGADLLAEKNWNEFVRFVRKMHAGQVCTFKFFILVTLTRIWKISIICFFSFPMFAGLSSRP